MRAELNGHAPETEEIFPPLRPAHHHQKGAQIIEKIHPHKLIGAAERGGVIQIFFIWLIFIDLILNYTPPFRHSY